jgi:N-terminal domain of anti-restriction factor ArdC
MPPGRRAPTGAQRQKWAEQRHAKLAELHTQLVEQVSTLTDGEAWRAWLSFATRFHAYSFNNMILIWKQRPEATWVAGIKRWNSMGRRVRKGERGIAILAPVTARPDTAEPEPVPPDPPSPNLGPAAAPVLVAVTAAAATALVEAALAQLDNPANKLGRVLRGFTIATVFDLAQTEGDPVQPPHRPTASDVDALLLGGQAPPGVWDALVGIAGEHGYRVQRGFCDGANGYIRYAEHLIRVRDDVDDAQAVKTLAHELAHMLLHSPDDFLGEFTGACRGEKEVEAESTAFLLAAHAGLDTGEYTFGYVTGWAEQAVTQTGKAPHEIVQATGARVVRAATQLTTALDTALGHGEPEVAAALVQRVGAGVQAAAQARTSAQAAAAAQATLFDTEPAAGRAFPPPTPTAALPAATRPPAPPASPARGPHR